MRILFLKAAALIVAMGAMHAQAAPRLLTCNFEPDAVTKEKAAIAKTGGVVARSGKYELTIQTVKGPVKLQNKPPYAEDIARSRYGFCDRDDGYVLVQMRVNSEATGVLVNEQTGAVTKAGNAVLFSPDKRAYLAIVENESGESSEWDLYSADGKLTWRGESMIIEGKSGEGVILAYLGSPTWSAAGELWANASCANEDKIVWQAKLVKSSGKWDWSPKKACPKS